MTRAPLVAAILATLVSTPPVWAQNVLGGAILDGREIEILSDNTWRFVVTTEDGCVPIDGPIELCESTVWQRVPTTPSPAIDALFQRDDRSFAMMIVEGVGRADGLSNEALEEVVLNNAAAAMELSAGSVPVVERYEVEIDGTLYPVITFEAELQGLSFTYHVAMLLEEQSATQLTTYTIGESTSEAQRQAHEDFVSNIRIAE